MVKENVEQVEARIQRAVQKAGRSRDQVTLIAVSKLFPASAIREAYAFGLRDFGENYVQESEGKLPELVDLEGARFHFIGHLQSNKARRATELFHVIQTVDNARLARRLHQAGRRMPVMLEVKLSGEGSKSGVAPEEIPALIDAIKGFANLELTGLMTMPPFSDDAEHSRPFFRQLRQLAEQYNLPNLSMGMSGDLEVAIEEGATHVRVGTALFGSRTYP